MPALKGKRKQLSTEESNDSRFVSKIVLCAGIMKHKHHLLDHKIDKKLILKVGISKCLETVPGKKDELNLCLE